jgi:uncharacterized alpha-E superfamily protein
MNDIAEIEFDTSLPLFFDPYAENREMGALILIDVVTNATVGAAMIVAPLEQATAKAKTFVWLRGQIAEAQALCEAMHAQGKAAAIVDDALIPEESLVAAVRALQLAQVTAISARETLSDATWRALERLEEQV